MTMIRQLILRTFFALLVGVVWCKECVADSLTDRPGEPWYKIHGDNGGEKNYKCASFMDELSGNQQKDALKYGYFAKIAYSETAEDVRKKLDEAHEDGRCLSDDGYASLVEGVKLQKIMDNIKDDGLKLTYGSDGTIHSERDGKADNGKTKFDAKILTKKDVAGNVTEVVIAFRGTQFTNWRDWTDNAKQVANFTPRQYKQAAALLEAVLSSEDYKDAKVVCTGHSLGGGLVTYAMASTDLKGRDVMGYTYDAAGISNMVAKSTKHAIAAKERITNVRAQWDPVSYVGYHLGEMYELGIGTDLVRENHSLDTLIQAMEMPSGSSQKSDFKVVTENVLDTVILAMKKIPNGSNGWLKTTTRETILKVLEEILKQLQNDKKGIVSAQEYLNLISALQSYINGDASTGETTTEEGGKKDSSADPFNSEPTNAGGNPTAGGSSPTGGSGGNGSSTSGGQSSSNNGGYNGIKAIKIFHY